MKSGITEKLTHNELLIKVVLVVILFCCTFVTFKAFQKPVIYEHTLKKITHTYNRDAVLKYVIWEVQQPYYYMDSQNTCRWDASNYSSIRENYYDGDDSKYAFFPLFPLLWKISHIGVIFIGLFNYLLFAASVILLSMLFLKNETTSMIERLCVFAVAILLPPIVTYYMPYAEALFTLLFVLALYGLIKNKYWLFFIAILLFVMTRPIFVIVGLSFVIMDSIYFIKHRNVIHFFKELSFKLLPLIIGTGIVFYMFYLNSGSFTKYFESVNQYWHTSFRIPTKITDWSIEAFGMTVFTIFFIILPSLILFIKNNMGIIASDKKPELLSIFNGNKKFIRTYFFNQSIVYIWGVFLFIVFFQGGELNGVCRYVIASPFFFIFLFYFYSDLKKFNFKRLLIITILLIICSFFMLISQPELQPRINFNDSGYFTLLLSFMYLCILRFLNNRLKVISLAIIAIYNIVWITYLYNIYLCNGWIFT